MQEFSVDVAKMPTLPNINVLNEKLRKISVSCSYYISNPFNNYSDILLDLGVAG